MARTALGFPYAVPRWLAPADRGDRRHALARARHRMGQPVSQADRDALVSGLAEAQRKMAAVQAWASAQADLNGALGADAARFNTLKGLVDSEAPGAVSAFSILQQGDPAAWDISAQRDDAEAYMAGANELSGIVERAAPSQWAPLLNAIARGANALIPAILAPRPPIVQPRPVTAPPPPAQPSTGWPWWAYGLTALAGLGLVGGLVSALAPRKAASTVVVAGSEGMEP